MPQAPTTSYSALESRPNPRSGSDPSRGRTRFFARSAVKHRPQSKWGIGASNERPRQGKGVIKLDGIKRVTVVIDYADGSQLKRKATAGQVTAELLKALLEFIRGL